MAKYMNVINFDLDGTLADLYGVEGWLNDLTNSNPRPYIVAKPLINMSALARKLNQLINRGYKINIISWLSKCSNSEFDELVTNAKLNWLKKHLKSVKFENIHIVPYGTPKHTLENGILFDDEKGNRDKWIGKAYDVNDIMGVLNRL